MSIMLTNILYWAWHPGDYSHLLPSLPVAQHGEEGEDLVQAGKGEGHRPEYLQAGQLFLAAGHTALL